MYKLQPVFDYAESHYIWPGLQIKHDKKNNIGVFATDNIAAGTCIPIISEDSNNNTWSLQSPECIATYIKELYNKKPNCIQHTTGILVTKLINKGEELTWCSLRKLTDQYKHNWVDDFPIMYA
jgi:hypothetical protein